MKVVHFKRNCTAVLRECTAEMHQLLWSVSNVRSRTASSWNKQFSNSLSFAISERKLSTYFIQNYSFLRILITRADIFLESVCTCFCMWREKANMRKHIRYPEIKWKKNKPIQGIAYRGQFQVLTVLWDCDHKTALRVTYSPCVSMSCSPATIVVLRVPNPVGS